jgi:hypothetical protein
MKSKQTKKTKSKTKYSNTRTSIRSKSKSITKPKIQSLNSSSSRKPTMKSFMINDSNIITISKPSAPRKLFHSHPKTAYHLSRSSFYKKDKPDKVLEFIDDYSYELNQGKTIDAKIIEQKLFNHDTSNCICQNINTETETNTNKPNPLDDNCKCSNLKVYSKQGKSGASINSIECNGVKDILKLVPLGNYYIKKRDETKKYIFLEMDGFTIQTIINTYVYRELPFNTVAINNSGVCIKEKKQLLGKNYMGYNLMSEADMGSGEDFINKLLRGDLDKEFGIQDNAYGRDTRYKIFVNFLLQSICILGHLQSSSLEFFHGDYKPNNVFVKRLEISKTDYYNFNIVGIPIKIRNMGFAVLIADFDRSSITLKSSGDKINKKYRIISPILFKPLLAASVNKTIKKYGNSDPDKVKEVQLNKFGVSSIIPKSKDPTITILRSAGVRYFRDIDLYTFFIRLIHNQPMLEYILEHKLDETIMAFMSGKFRNYFIGLKPKDISMNNAAYLVVDIFSKIHEPMPRVFTTKYIKSLDILNLYLFEPK